MGSTPVLTWSASGRLDPLSDAEDAPLMPINLNPFSATVPMVLPHGMVLGEVLASQGLYNFYDTQKSDGTQNAKGLLQYRAAVTGTAGSAGTIQGIATGVGGEWPGITSPVTAMFKAGEFDLGKIVGLDSATPASTLAARLLSGAYDINEVDSFGDTGAETGTWGMTIPSVTVNGFVYPAVTIANTALANNISAANLVIAINNALWGAGIPAYVTATGGAFGTAAIVVTWHGAYGGASFVVAPDYTQLSATPPFSRSTHGVHGYGRIRLG